jgi:hypothetical protein
MLMKKKARIKIPGVELRHEVETELVDVENDRHHMFDMAKRRGAVGSDCR